MERATSYLTALPSSKEESISFANKLAAEIESGEVDIFKIVLQRKMIEKVFKHLDDKTKYKKIVDSEFSKQGDTFTIGSTKFTKRSKKSINYENCNDPIYNDLLNKLSKRKLFLDSLTDNVDIVDDLTGEYYTISLPEISYTNYWNVEL
jgi:hypothetical protein